MLVGMSAFTDLPKRFRRMIVSEDLAVGQTSTPDASAALEVESTTKGALFPRMTEVQRDAVSSPATGLVVYNSDTDKYNYYDGTAWEELGTGGGGIIEEWQLGTCASNWVTNTTIVCYFRRVGGSAQIKINVATSGVPTATALNVDIPSEIPVIDTAKLPTTTDNPVVGYGNIIDTGTTWHPTSVRYIDTNTVDVLFFLDAASTPGSNVTHTSPFAFNSGDGVNIIIEVPISTWAATGVAESDVQSPRVDVTQICTSYISNGGSPTVTRSDGDCVDSLTDNGVGDVTINFAAGTFSDGPNCQCTARESLYMTLCWFDESTLDKDEITARTFRADTNVAVDSDFMIDCTGPK